MQETENNNNKPQLWMIVGGNGAGKSTFYNDNLKEYGLPFVNADEIAKQFFPGEAESRSLDAAKIAETMRQRYLETGKSFCFETVFSHPSKIDFMAKAKAMGYEVIMVYIHLDNVSLNKARVHHRVQEGGHSVPEEKIETRIPRTLENASKAVSLCDRVHVLDNSNDQDRHKQILMIKNGNRTNEVTPLPDWALKF